MQRNCYRNVIVVIPPRTRQAGDALLPIRRDDSPRRLFGHRGNPYWKMVRRRYVCVLRRHATGSGRADAVHREEN